MKKAEIAQQAGKNLVTSAKVTVQASLLTVAYSVGYGAGAAARTFNKIVGEKKLGFVKEMMTEAGKGYEDAVTKEEIEAEIAGFSAA